MYISSTKMYISTGEILFLSGGRQIGIISCFGTNGLP